MTTYHHSCLLLRFLLLLPSNPSSQDIDLITLLPSLVPSLLFVVYWIKSMLLWLAFYLASFCTLAPAQFTILFSPTCLPLNNTPSQQIVWLFFLTNPTLSHLWVSGCSRAPVNKDILSSFPSLRFTSQILPKPENLASEHLQICKVASSLNPNFTPYSLHESVMLHSTTNNDLHESSLPRTGKHTEFSFFL